MNYSCKCYCSNMHTLDVHTHTASMYHFVNSGFSSHTQESNSTAHKSRLQIEVFVTIMYKVITVCV